MKTLQLVTDVNAIRPGEDITVGLWFRHEEGYHTYWKSPGIVGVSAMIQWKDLPEGFEPGEIQWPAPQTTIMATLTAWGYEEDTCLLVPMRVPKDLKGKTEITLKARVGWMCCSKTCHPGWHDFSLTIPVSDPEAKESNLDAKWREQFEISRSRMPLPTPDGWTFSAKEIDKGSIQMVVNAPDKSGAVDWSKAYFFADDNQVDSDEPQVIVEKSGPYGAFFTFARPEFAPENPKVLSGVLYHPDGWPALNGHRWMIASAPWPEYEVPNSDGQGSN